MSGLRCLAAKGFTLFPARVYLALGYNPTALVGIFLLAIGSERLSQKSAHRVNPANYIFATVDGARIEWFLRRNCAMSPRQFGACYGFISTISLCIGVFFWAQGATLVVPFSALEIIVLGVGFLCVARRASDREIIRIDGHRVTVECELSGVIHQASFERAWLSVECPKRPQQLIELRGQGKVIEVGRFVRPEWRSALAAEIRQGVRLG